MEGACKVIWEGAAIVLLARWNQAGEGHQKQQEKLEWESCSQHPEEEAVLRSRLMPRVFRTGGTGATSCGPEERIQNRNKPTQPWKMASGLVCSQNNIRYKSIRGIHNRWSQIFPRWGSEIRCVFIKNHLVSHISNSTKYNNHLSS